MLVVHAKDTVAAGAVLSHFICVVEIGLSISVADKFMCSTYDCKTFFEFILLMVLLAAVCYT